MVITAKEAYALSQKANKAFENIGKLIKQAAINGHTKIDIIAPAGCSMSRMCDFFIGKEYTISYDKNIPAHGHTDKNVVCTISWKPIG